MCCGEEKQGGLEGLSQKELKQLVQVQDGRIPRREFLKYSGGAGAGMLLSGALSPLQPASANMSDASTLTGDTFITRVVPFDLSGGVSETPADTGIVHSVCVSTVSPVLPSTMSFNGQAIIMGDGFGDFCPPFLPKRLRREDPFDFCFVFPIKAQITITMFPVGNPALAKTTPALTSPSQPFGLTFDGLSPSLFTPLVPETLKCCNGKDLKIGVRTITWAVIIKRIAAKPIGNVSVFFDQGGGCGCQPCNDDPRCK